MGSKRHRPRTSSNNLTERYGFGEFDAASLDDSDDPTGQQFTSRNKNAQQNKTAKTAALRAALRAAEVALQPDLQQLPIGQVTQVYSLFCEVEHGGKILLCVVRKTLAKVSATQLVVGDYVRFREGGTKDESGRDEAVIEEILPRKTILTRTNSFKSNTQHPIVANADQMLIVASVKLPELKWGLIDRMIIAARGGGLAPIICLNKIELLEKADPDPLEALAHYASMGITTLTTSVHTGVGLEQLQATLKDRTTVLSGHSGVGKSSLIRAIQPDLDLRIGAISQFTAKGRHTTTSARRYILHIGGVVIDTPGVKVFGLWGVHRDNLLEFFPDITNGSAPTWRNESYERIKGTL